MFFVFEPIEFIEFGLDYLASVGRVESAVHRCEHKRGRDYRRGTDQERHVRVGALYELRRRIRRQTATNESETSESTVRLKVVRPASNSRRTVVWFSSR